MSVDSHVSTTSELFSWGCCKEGALQALAVSHPCPPSNLLYITSRYAYMKHLFCWRLILIFLYFKLGVLTYYPLAWMFFFRTLSTAFPTANLMKIVCSCWVWKLSNVACPLNLVPSASFLIQSDWLQKADQSLCVRKEALGTRLIPTKTMVRCYVIGIA